jgi:hypothetical protein
MERAADLGGHQLPMRTSFVQEAAKQKTRGRTMNVFVAKRWAEWKFYSRRPQIDRVQFRSVYSLVRRVFPGLWGTSSFRQLGRHSAANVGVHAFGTAFSTQ